ncbi:MAG: HAD family hydrolase [Kiritimatiellia bacterium]|jgi:phosphoglycolate phosphatase
MKRTELETAGHPRPRHIVWDWNGTLQDDVHAAVNGINHLLVQRGLPTVDIDRHRRLFSFPVRNYYTALGFKLEQENWERLSKDFIDAFLRDEPYELFHGARAALEALHDNGVAMSVLSASEQSTLDASLARHGLRDFFCNVKGLDNHGAASKVHLAESLFARIGGPFDDVWIVGDTTHDKEVADAAGCQCLLLACGYQSQERLLACGCDVLDSIANVPAFFGCKSN